MGKEYLFSRHFKGEEYKFYRDTLYLKSGPYTYFYVETPVNSLDYPDSIQFAHGIPYSKWRYCPQWILKECKKALLKKAISRKPKLDRKV